MIFSSVLLITGDFCCSTACLPCACVFTDASGVFSKENVCVSVPWHSFVRA